MSDWNPENAITESELEFAAKNGAIEKFNIFQNEDGFYIVVRLNWRAEDLHVVTRRERSFPKIWVGISRLINHIQNKLPWITEIALHILRKENASSSHYKANKYRPLRTNVLGQK